MDDSLVDLRVRSAKVLFIAGERIGGFLTDAEGEIEHPPFSESLSVYGSSSLSPADRSSLAPSKGSKSSKSLRIGLCLGSVMIKTERLLMRNARFEL